MNDQERAELQALKQRQVRLEEELALFATHIKAFEQRLTQQKQQPTPPEPATKPAPIRVPLPAAARVAIPPQPTPPVIPVGTTASAMETGEAQRPTLRLRAEPVETNIVESVAPIPVPPPLARAAVPTPPSAASSRTPRSPEAPKSAAAAKGSFEMRLGTYWFVRIGIVLILTALVFFGKLAYQKYINQLGPGGKVALLYVASALLLGAGAWWQRRAAKPSLKNYAQVLFAGGLAAVYFTTYAAYYNDHLKIIQDRTLDGLLLLAWAGFMTWVADRKKSEVLALFAVGLAYYTSIITRVGYFTLYSNLLLTVTAVFFLVRNRWVALSLAQPGRDLRLVCVLALLQRQRMALGIAERGPVDGHLFPDELLGRVHRGDVPVAG